MIVRIVLILLFLMKNSTMSIWGDSVPRSQPWVWLTPRVAVKATSGYPVGEFIAAIVMVVDRDPRGILLKTYYLLIHFVNHFYLPFIVKKCKTILPTI